jgi:hypothetical protein
MEVRVATLDYTKDPVIRRGKCFDPKTPYCERCGQEIRDMSKAVNVTFNCDTFQVFLGHDVDTGYKNKQVVGNTVLGSDCAKKIGLLNASGKSGYDDA